MGKRWEQRSQGHDGQGVVYPGVSFFTTATIQSTAAKCGLSAEIKPQYTEYYIVRRPAEYHDWVMFKFRPSR
jgi:hypothetical protein